MTEHKVSCNRDGLIGWIENSATTTRVSIGSEYVERFWTPRVGPSGIAVLRWAHLNQPTAYPLRDLGPRIGLGETFGPHTPMWRTLTRLASFHLVEIAHSGNVVVWSHVFPLSQRNLAQLPPALRDEEKQWWTSKSVPVDAWVNDATAGIVYEPPRLIG